MKKFYLGSLTYIVLFLLVTWYMYSDDRAFDGPLTLGFPLPFYYGGGFCMVPCGPHFYADRFILDVLFLILPIIAAYWYQNRKIPITQ
ncbi:hypothetical protein KBC86_03855 [Candidatus Gracilibacteria bacterium]|nr:hypothetical protein [Candidatus Gracilibacteria bacterium]